MYCLAPRVHAQRVLARPQRDVKVRIRRKNPLLLARVVRNHHHRPAALAGGGWGHARAQGALEHGWVRRQHAVVGRRSWHHLAAVSGNGLLHGCVQRDTLAGERGFTLETWQSLGRLLLCLSLSLHGPLLCVGRNRVITGAIRKWANLMIGDKT